MKKFLIATALFGTLAAGPFASPALADGKASTRNIIIGTGAAVGAGILITNYNHKKRIKREEEAARARRQAAYKRAHHQI